MFLIIIVYQTVLIINMQLFFCLLNSLLRLTQGGGPSPDPTPGGAKPKAHWDTSQRRRSYTLSLKNVLISSLCSESRLCSSGGGANDTGPYIGGDTDLREDHAKNNLGWKSKALEFWEVKDTFSFPHFCISMSAWMKHRPLGYLNHLYKNSPLRVIWINMDDFSEVKAVRAFWIQTDCSSPARNIMQDQFPNGFFTYDSLEISRCVGVCVYAWAA